MLQRMLCAIHKATTRHRATHVESVFCSRRQGNFSTSGAWSGLKLNEYAYEVLSSNVRFGLGVTREVGLDCQNLKVRNVCVMTDSNLASLEPVKVTLQALEQAKVSFTVYDQVRIEPTDVSFKEAIDFAKHGEFDAFVAVGGGSVMETCKAANLYASNPSAAFVDYIIAPIGLGRNVTQPLKPLIAVPTTAGSGSEMTGTATFDYLNLRSKTGISKRALRPTLALLDPLHLRFVPPKVAVYTGLDVLCHALESLTCRRYFDRYPRPDFPWQRPMYQGGHPVSDVWASHALQLVSKYLIRAVRDPEDLEAQSQMLMASCFAGIATGNTGVHLCHAFGCPISSLVKHFVSSDYDNSHPMVPHGLAVMMTAPAVFRFTALASPDLHLDIAHCLGADGRNRGKREDAGVILGDVLRELMQQLGCPNGLEALGYTPHDVPELVQWTLPQRQMTELCPRAAREEDYGQILLDSMTVY